MLPSLSRLSARADRHWPVKHGGRSQKSVLIKQLRYKAVEQKTLSSP
jgi:hypothetical protein